MIDSHITPCVQSDLPEPDSYIPYILEAHITNRYSNFGKLAELFSVTLMENFGNLGEGCVPCSSATAGLSAALVASGCPGPVLIPGFTFPATYGAVCAANLDPIVMDVDISSWAIAPDDLASTIDKTEAKGAILVSPFGLRIDFKEHIEICRSRGVTVVIDSAAGLGVERVHTCADPSVFEVYSLHATKPLGIGEGGAIFCARSAVSAVRSALNFGMSTLGHSNAPTSNWGFNGKLSEFHAAVGIAQMQRYRQMIAGRQKFASIYQSLLPGFPVNFNNDRPDTTPWQVFPVLMPSEEALLLASEELIKVGIEVRRYYRPSISQLVDVKMANPCPVSEQLAACMLALPIRSISLDSDAEPIISRVEAAFAHTFSGALHAF